jgi:hypothetical protein
MITELIVYPSLIGGVIGFLYRQYVAYETSQRNSWSIVYTDPFFSKFATINVLSFVYAIFIGVATGFGFGCILEFLRGEGANANFMLYAISSLLMVFFTRLSFEASVLLYKVAQKYLDSP